MKIFINKNDITFRTEANILRAFAKSIENNSKETFYVLYKFVQKILELSIRKESINHFQQYIFFPASIYKISHESKLHNTSLEHIHKLSTNRVSSNLKDIIYLHIGIKVNGIQDLEERKKINHYYYWAFNGFSTLLYHMVTNRDIQKFEVALNEYVKTSNSQYSINYEQSRRIRNLEQQNIDGRYDEKIKALKEEDSVFSEFESYKRHAILGIKYLIWFLFNNQKLKKDELLAFHDIMEARFSNTMVVLKDMLYFMKGTPYNYMEWDEWSINENRSNPPYTSDWLTLGFMADQIRHNSSLINQEELNSEELSQVSLLYSKLKKHVEYFKHNIDHWQSVLKVESLECLEQRSKKILSRFAVLERKSVGSTEKAIANAELSSNKITEFKNIIGKTWELQARINNLFKEFGTAELVTNENIELKHIGQRTFFEKAKMMFIEGEYYQRIYGVEEMGGVIGKWEDDEFFNTVFNSDHNKVSGTSVLQVLNKAIAELKSKDLLPDLILLSPEYSYKDKELLGSKLFTKQYRSTEEDHPALIRLGIFDGVPVYSSHSEFLKNRVLIGDFKTAFKMRYKTNPDWYKNELTVDVKVVTDEEAQRRLAEQPDKWKRTEEGITLSNEDALTLIKTSVIIDHWSTLDFKVENKEAFVVGYLTTDSKTE